MMRDERHTENGRVHTRANSGFTLVELMAVAAIMVLAAVIVATGMPSAFSAYTAASDASNAQVMLSTTTTRLRDVLSVADPNADITSAGTSEGGAGDHDLITFDSLETGYTTAVKWNSTLGLYLVESSAADDVLAPGESSPSSTGYSVTTPLVPATTDGGSGPRLHTEAASITYEGGAFVIHGLKVVRDDGVNLANAEVDELRVYPIVR